MTRLTTILILLVSFLCSSQTIESNQRGYYKAKVGDTILSNRTTERKAKDDGLNYALKNGFDSYKILFPDYVNVKLKGFKKDTIAPPVIKDTIAIDHVFKFDPDKLGIVQGVVDYDTALNNTKIWNEVVSGLPEEVNIVEIDRMDAFFEVADYDYRAAKFNKDHALRLRDNLHLKMSDNTHLRVYPNASFSFHLLSVFELNNVEISGGNIHGDRYEHDYSAISDKFGYPRNSHEWGYALNITSSKNIFLHNINISSSSGDGININASHIRHRDGTPNKAVVSENITIENCFITESRRNNISVVDGNRIYILNNTITRSGLGEGEGIGSWGIDPRCGIDLEAYNESGPNKEIYEYEKVENVTIKGNTFVSNRKVDIIGFIASNILIEANTLEKSIVLQYASKAIIRNNIMNSTADEDGNTASSGISTSNSRRVHDIDIYDNKLTGFKNSLVLSGTNVEAYNNTVKQFSTGLVLGTLTDSEIHDNTYTSTIPTSYGIRSVNGGGEGIVNIYNESFTSTHKPINLRNYNRNSTGSLLVENSTFNCSSSNSGFDLSITNCKNIEFKNITSNREFDVVDSENIKY